MYPFLVPIIAIIAGTIMAIGIPIARAYAKRIEGAPSTPSDLGLRLQHMEEAIDAIAVDIERISEAQRFTTKLLSERSSERSADQPTRPLMPEHTP